MRKTHPLKKVRFEQFEANNILRIAMIVSHHIETLEKSIYNDDKNLEKYIEKRRKLETQTKEYMKNIEEILND